MADVLRGFRVVEVAMYTFGPSAAAVLGDWGADVVKVVHPDFADPLMGSPVADLPDRDVDVKFLWEICNRNKRSVGIAIDQPQGHAVLDRLVRTADVFLTSFLPGSRARLGIDIDDIRRVNPDIVYARASGQGPAGPEGDKGGYDHTSYWARTGIAHGAAQVTGEFIPQIGPTFGDLASGFALASGVTAALLQRERTGYAPVVDVSLFGTGLWMFSPSVVASELYDVDTIPRVRHRDLPNPLVAAYTTKDTRQVYLAGVRTDGDWANFCECIGRPDLATDARFHDGPSRLAHRQECIELLDAVFASRCLDEWRTALARLTTPWSVVQSAREVHTDEQVLANGYVVPAVDPDGRAFTLVASPVQFDGERTPLRSAPGHGVDTDALLEELGYDEAEALALKEVSAVL